MDAINSQVSLPHPQLHFFSRRNYRTDPTSSSSFHPRHTLTQLVNTTTAASYPPHSIDFNVRCTESMQRGLFASALPGLGGPQILECLFGIFSLCHSMDSSPRIYCYKGRGRKNNANRIDELTHYIGCVSHASLPVDTPNAHNSLQGRDRVADADPEVTVGLECADSSPRPLEVMGNSGTPSIYVTIQDLRPNQSRAFQLNPYRQAALYIPLLSTSSLHNCLPTAQCVNS